jgi:hypothetical protein
MTSSPRSLEGKSLRGVDVADGDGQGVGCIGWFRGLREVEEAGDHELHLFFACESVTDYGGFDFEWRVFGEWEIGGGCD